MPRMEIMFDSSAFSGRKTLPRQTRVPNTFAAGFVAAVPGKKIGVPRPRPAGTSPGLLRLKSWYRSTWESASSSSAVRGVGGPTPSEAADDERGVGGDVGVRCDSTLT